MTTLPHIISLSNLEQQTGMTTLGIAMVNGTAIRVPRTVLPVYVAPTQEQAHYAINVRGLHAEKASWFDQMFRPASYKLISLAVIDDCDQYKFHELRALIGAIVNRMQTVTTPCQIVLLRNPFNVKDLF